MQFHKYDFMETSIFNKWDSHSLVTIKARACAILNLNNPTSDNIAELNEIQEFALVKLALQGEDWRDWEGFYYAIIERRANHGC